MNGERMIIDPLEFVVKELDRYGEIIHDHEWTEGPDILRSKTYVYNNKLYDVTRKNGSIKSFYFWGKLDDELQIR